MAAVTVPGPARLASLRARLGAAASSAAEVAGRVTGRALGFRRAVPGLAGAAGLSVAVGEVASHVFGHGLAPWVGLGAGSVFALLADRRIP